jgi:ribosome-binding factor A
MPREFSRSRRVEEQIHRLLAEFVRREVKDPRVGPVTLTAVEVSRDMSHAKVFFLPFDQARDPAEVGKALASAAGFLRSLLRKQLSMRQVPELHFLPDESIDRAAKLSALINRAVRDDEARHVDEPPGADDDPRANADETDADDADDASGDDDGGGDDTDASSDDDREPRASGKDA